MRHACRIADQFVPVVRRHLAGHGGRALAIAVVQQLQHVAALFCGERGEAPVVGDQQIGLGVAAQLGEAAVAMGQAQFF